MKKKIISAILVVIMGVVVSFLFFEKQNEAKADCVHVIFPNPDVCIDVCSYGYGHPSCNIGRSHPQ